MTTWISVVSGALGGVIGVLGTLLGARLQFKEAARVRTEQYRREDRFRLHKERIDAYADFYISAGIARRAMASGAEQRKLSQARNRLWRAFARVLLVGEEEVLRSARPILTYVSDVAYEGVKFDADRYRELIAGFQRSARGDVAIRDRPS